MNNALGCITSISATFHFIACQPHSFNYIKIWNFPQYLTFARRHKFASSEVGKREEIPLSPSLHQLLFCSYSIMLETTPAPTVRPPSRIAKRNPSSIAIGVMSSMVILMLSPGITISTPSGRVVTPVTSVVLK